jgi:hypothetical protein
MKPAFIILVVVGVLFAVVLFASRSNHADTAPEDPDARESLAQTHEPPSLVTFFGGLLGRWSPKVRFAQTAYSITGGLDVQVPPSDEAFRRATIHVAPPHCETIAIVYDAAEGEGADMKLEHQEWKGSEREPCVGSFVVRPKGGTIAITCPPNQTCSFTFE